jgi:hypothetical protein
MSQPIKLEALRELVQAGTVKAATILGQKGGYAVVANIGMAQRPLGTKAGEVRMFSTTDTAVKVLRELGVVQFHLDVSQYEPGSLRPGRPDTTNQAKHAAQALAHDSWFRGEVERTLTALKNGAKTIDSDTMWRGLTDDAKRINEKRHAGKQ